MALTASIAMPHCNIHPKRAFLDMVHLPGLYLVCVYFHSMLEKNALT
jgi:hypothetical protein